MDMLTMGVTEGKIFYGGSAQRWRTGVGQESASLCFNIMPMPTLLPHLHLALTPGIINHPCACGSRYPRHCLQAEPSPCKDSSPFPELHHASVSDTTSHARIQTSFLTSLSTCSVRQAR